MDKIRIDQLSFWIGFAAASLFWWLFGQARPAFKLVRQALRERFGAVKKGLSVNAEQRYRQDALKLFGDEHLTAPLFSLQEIAIQPRLLVPPPPVIPGMALPPESITDIAVPYLPDYAEVGGQFGVGTISIPTAMSKGGNLLLMGKPGSGRTVALSLLATQVAQRHPDVGELGNLIPIYVHAGALNLSKNDKPIEMLYDAFYERVSILLEASLIEFFSKVFESGLALLLVDGLDELPKESQKDVVVFVRNLQRSFPGNRYIVATSEDDLYCQEALNLHSYALAGWDAGQKQAYIKKWGELWTAHITRQSWASELPELYDPLILNNWLLDDTRLASPFFTTLKVWAAYAGDQRGPGELDAIESYLKRMSVGIKNARPALENLASQSILNQTPFLETRKARSYIAAFEELVTGELPEIDLLETAEDLLEELDGSGGGGESSSAQDEDDLDSLLEKLDQLDPTTLKPKQVSPGLDDEELDGLLEKLDQLDPTTLKPKQVSPGLEAEELDGLLEKLDQLDLTTLKSKQVSPGLEAEELDGLLEKLDQLDLVTLKPKQARPEPEDEDLDALLQELDELDLGKEEPKPVKPEPAAKVEKPSAKPSGRMLLPTLTEAGLLVALPNGSYGFRHPIFAGYLAGANLSGAESQRLLNQQKNWSGKHLAQLFLPAYKADMSTFLAEVEQQAASDPIRSRLVRVSSWVRYAPRNANWRNQFLRMLATTLQDESLPLGLRARLMASLAYSGEAGIGTLFKQMLGSQKYSVRWLGVLGGGILKSQSVVEDLGQMLYDPSIFVSRAACLALVTIGSNRALEMVTAALLQANDEVRRAAAEALALHPLEGHPVLKDGASVEDVRVRRAVVFGLARVQEEWAQEILARLQVEDDQWVVRNAAAQTIEDMKLAKLSLPEGLPPIHKIPWLIAFAGEKGMGLAPGQAGWDLLVEALKEGSEEMQLAAMYIYRRTPSEAYSAVPVLKEILNGPDGEIREMAYYTLWHLRATGVSLQTTA